MARNIQTVFHSETTLIFYARARTAHEKVVIQTNGIEKEPNENIGDYSATNYSHFLLFSAMTPRDNKPMRMTMARKSVDFLVPGAVQHQGKPRDITDISLSLNGTPYRLPRYFRA